jgi:chromosomal replication initiation ATPase DnaA
MTARQLPLDLAAPPALSREDFVTGASNRAALDLVERWPDWPARVLVLWGPPGCGKSHLAAIWRARSGATEWQPGHDGLLAAASGALTIDGLPPGLPEADLLHLVNLVGERRGWLLVTGEAPPARWDLRLPDLRSRLLAAPAVGVEAPDDALLAAVLTKQFSDRQLRVTAEVIGYLTARIERSYASVRAVVGAIDEAALAVRREITPALARQVVERLSQRPLL